MRCFLSAALPRLAFFLFFSAFLGIGLTLFFGLIVPSLHSYWRTRDEVTTSAILTEVHLESHGGGSRRRTSTDARYRYQFNGTSYEGTELAIFRHTEEFYGRLKQNLDQSRPIRVYIDPKNPAYSVYDRNFSIWPFAGGLVMSIGFSVMGTIGLRSMFKLASPNLPAPRYRDSNWSS